MLCDEFAVFILTHGRAKNVITAKTLHELGYTGKYYIVIDDEDDQEEEYRKIYGDISNSVGFGRHCHYHFAPTSCLCI